MLVSFTVEAELCAEPHRWTSQAGSRVQIIISYDELHFLRCAGITIVFYRLYIASCVCHMIVIKSWFACFRFYRKGSIWKDLFLSLIDLLYTCLKISLKEDTIYDDYMQSKPVNRLTLIILVKRRSQNKLSLLIVRGGGGTSIETLYGDVPPKWVSFWQKIPKHGSHFWPPNP